VIGTHSTQLWQQDSIGLITLITDTPNPDLVSVFPRTFSSQDDVPPADFEHNGSVQKQAATHNGPAGRVHQAGSRDRQEGNVEL
jgi:hypothetical protein